LRLASDLVIDVQARQARSSRVGRIARERERERERELVLFSTRAVGSRRLQANVAETWTNATARVGVQIWSANATATNERRNTNE